jgi:hypothetical protein
MRRAWGLAAVIVLAGLVGLSWPAQAAPQAASTRMPTASWLTPSPTPTARPPVLDLFGQPMVDSLRITTDEIWHLGDGSVQGVMQTEADPLVVARVAMAESPGNFNDRMLVIWLIRLRSELGFKNAGEYAGTRARPDRWGPPTTIKQEALCDGGCQFEVVRATFGIYWPEGIKSPGIRAMVSPDDEQIGDLWLTYQAAVFILSSPLSGFPAELRGYDSFRSPSLAWHGTRYYSGGLRSRQMFPRGLVWRDESPQDNTFWTAYVPTPAPTIVPYVPPSSPRFPYKDP